MTILIRTADPADRATAIDLLQDLNVFENAITGDRLEHRRAAEESYERMMERIARRDGRLLLAAAEGRVVGLMGFSIEEDQPFVREDLRRYGHVTDLIVHADWRGRGVGRALLDEAERLTRARGLKRLGIGVLAGNEGALRAYQAFGFEDYVRLLVKELA